MYTNSSTQIEILQKTIQVKKIIMKMSQVNENYHEDRDYFSRVISLQCITENLYKLTSQQIFFEICSKNLLSIKENFEKKVCAVLTF